MYCFISYTQFYVLNTQFFSKQSSIAHITIVVKDGLFWLGIVTSPRERDILALWHYIRRLLLHGQIGAKAIFTSE